MIFRFILIILLKFENNIIWSVIQYLYEYGFLSILEYQKERIGDETYDYLTEQIKERGIKGDFVMYENRIIGVMSRKKQLTLTEMHQKNIDFDVPYRRIDDITKIKGLEKLRDLKVLDMNGNNISEIKGLKNLINLKRLDLSENKITEIKGLEKLENLEELDLGGNKITEIKGLENRTELRS